MQAFYRDFAHVADDEARHFGWCRQHLQALGYDYGCMPAHDLLWQGAQLSAGIHVQTPLMLTINFFRDLESACTGRQ